MPNFNISERDYLAASRIGAKIPLQAKLLFATLPFLISIPFVFDMSGDIKGGVAGGVIGGLIVIPLLVYVWLPAQWKSQYRSYKQLQVPINVEFSGDSIRYSSEFGATILPLADMYKWRDSKEYILLYQARNIFFIIPTRIDSVGFRIDELRDLLNEYVGTPS